MVLVTNVQRTDVFNILNHSKSTMSKGLEVVVGKFNRSNQERAGVGAKELVVTRANDHS